MMLFFVSFKLLWNILCLKVTLDILKTGLTTILVFVIMTFWLSVGLNELILAIPVLLLRETDPGSLRCMLRSSDPSWLASDPQLGTTDLHKWRPTVAPTTTTVCQRCSSSFMFCVSCFDELKMFLLVSKFGFLNSSLSQKFNLVHVSS